MLENIIAEAETGIRFSNPGEGVKDVRIGNNTFYKVRTGIEFAAMPRTNLSGNLEFYRNLFAGQQGPELSVKKDFAAVSFTGLTKANAGIQHNWSSREIPEPSAKGEVDIFVGGGKSGEEFEFKSTDPADERFLATSGNPPSSVADGPRGSKRYIGAVAP